MSNETKGPAADTCNLHVDTRRSIETLTSENEHLQTMLASLEQTRTQLEAQITHIKEALPDVDDMQHKLTDMKQEKEKLAEQAFQLQKELKRQRREHQDLQQQMSAIEEENERFLEQYTEATQQNAKLANLYATSYSLHETLDREEAVALIQEIIVNLVCSEEVAIFEADNKSKELKLISAKGIDEDIYHTIPFDQGIIGKTATTGDIFTAGDDDTDRSDKESELTACIPLKIEENIIGVIAIFKLLPQRMELAEIDREIFDLLITHASTAFYCTTLYAQATF